MQPRGWPGTELNSSSSHPAGMLPLGCLPVATFIAGYLIEDQRCNDCCHFSTLMLISMLYSDLCKVGFPVLRQSFFGGVLGAAGAAVPEAGLLLSFFPLSEPELLPASLLAAALYLSLR